MLGPGGGTIRGISAKTEAHCFLARHTYEPCLHAWGTPRQLDGVVIEVEMVVGDRVPGWRGPTRDMTGTGDGRGTGSRRDPGGWDEGRHEGRNEGGRNEGRDDDHGRHCEFSPVSAEISWVKVADALHSLR